MKQDAYVWQRAWTPEVRLAVQRAAPRLARLVVLAGELEWGQGSPRIIRPDIPWPLLVSLGTPVGLALRSSAPPSPDDAGAAISHLAAQLVTEARACGLEPAELQLDVDWPVSRLSACRSWTAATRSAVPGVPVTITALPAWLEDRLFAAVARDAGGFVLQVHGLEIPRLNAMRTCDPVVARRAVERAARAKVPFRVALPTYGYRASFRGERLTAYATDGETRAGGSGAVAFEVRTDAGAMAGLLSGWIDDRPAALLGAIWYRLPVDSDRRNWSWATFDAVLSGRIPASRVSATAVRDPAGAIEVLLQNSGDADLEAPTVVAVWSGARIVAADGLAEYRARIDAPSAVRFVPPSMWFAPGARATIGWLRLDSAAEVRVEVLR
jgi:hypothetical protein